MSSPFLAEIRIFACNFAPTGWATCNGQILPISQNTALFSLLGTFYGGNGQSTFALPDLQGSCALGQGQSTTGTDYSLGQSAGSQFITLLTAEMPLHNHVMQACADPANAQIPDPSEGLARSSGGQAWSTTATGLQLMNQQILSISGSSLPHNNMQPYITLTFCIALQGVFPARP
jgi:microcystin-dependent protein